MHCVSWLCGFSSGDQVRNSTGKQQLRHPTLTCGTYCNAHNATSTCYKPLLPAALKQQTSPLRESSMQSHQLTCRDGDVCCSDSCQQSAQLGSALQRCSHRGSTRGSCSSGNGTCKAETAAVNVSIAFSASE
jgi:hypothetical protein